MAYSIEDLEKDGFSVYGDNERPVKASPDKTPAVQPLGETKIVVIDNKDILKALAETNMSFQVATNILVKTLKEKPTSFTLKIERDHQGYMSNIQVTVNK